MYEETLYHFNPGATLQEIAHGLAAGDPDEIKRIRFTALVDGQMIGIGDDIILQTMRRSAQGSFRLMAKYRGSGSRSSRSSRAPSEYSFVEGSDAGSVSASRDTEASVSAALRYKVGYNGVLGEDNFLRLRGPLNTMSLLDLGQLVIEAQGLPTHSHICYLYNKCGWPLAASIEQAQLIAGDAYLVNGDFVYAIIWEERPPRPVVYVDPSAGSQAYCFDYSGMTLTVGVDMGSSVSDLKMKLLWLLRVPLATISVSKGEAMGALADDYAVTASDIQNKQLKFNFAPLSASFSQINDLYPIIDEKETRKLYGYLHLLKSFTPQT